VTGDTGVQSVKSARRTIEVLELLARRGASSLAAVQHELGHPKSSLYMLLQTLVDAGWVQLDPTGTRYSLGVRALLVGTSYIDASDVLSRARPVLDGLRDATTETIHLAQLDGCDVVYLATFESKHYLRPFSRVGRRQAAYLTSLGKALLAERSDDEVLRLLPGALLAQTPNSISSHDALLRELETTRHRGYALDNEESTTGLSCAGVALHDADPPVHSISCSVPVARLSPNRLDAIAADLLEARDRIDNMLRQHHQVITPE
jgi:DNA-binding IclR family transcriptional regulator